MFLTGRVPLERNLVIFPIIIQLFCKRNNTELLTFVHIFASTLPSPAKRGNCSVQVANFFGNPLDKRANIRYNNMERIPTITYERNLIIMKKLLAMLLCLVMVVSCVSVLASCDKDTKDPAKTDAPSKTEAPTEDASTPEDTSADETNPDESDDEDDVYVPVEGDVIITSVEDLLAFNKSVNEEYVYYEYVNVVFEADIDLAGHEWTPLYGDALINVTFVGNGHTISNMNINYNVDGSLTTADGNLVDELLAGAGFVGTSTHELYFEDLTFDNCYIKACERYVGCVLGRNFGGTVEMENVKVTNFKVDGWTDIDNKVTEDGAKVNIAMRVAGIMGANHGTAYFENCHVDNIELSGYHNLAGIVGVDQNEGGMLDEYCFVDCSVKNAKFNFSYGMKYDVNQNMKYVAVFFNAAGYVNKTDLLVEMGNSYEGVSFYDIANDAEYLPGDFVTPEVEEEAPAA